MHLELLIHFLTEGFNQYAYMLLKLHTWHAIRRRDMQSTSQSYKDIELMMRFEMDDFKYIFAQVNTFYLSIWYINECKQRNNGIIPFIVFRKLKIGIQLENTRSMHFRIRSNSLPNTWLRVVVSNLYSARIMKSL